MIRRRTLALAATLALAGTAALAQGFPTKPITFVVPFAAGSATDQLARALGAEVPATYARGWTALTPAT